MCGGGDREVVVGKLWCEFLTPITECLPKVAMLLQLGICAIPIFFKIPGISSADLGGRTEGLSSAYVIAFRAAHKS